MSSTQPDDTPPRIVVFDTNVALALMVFDDPALRALRESWDNGGIVAVVNDETLAEFERVLRYPALRLDEERAMSMAQRYRERCLMIATPTYGGSRLPRCRDPDDQKFLVLAERISARWLLTRDKALLAVRKKVAFVIATPESFLLAGAFRRGLTP